MENPGNQLLRWGLAGWTYFLQIMAILFIYKFALNYNGDFALLGGRVPIGKDSLASFSIVAGAGIPIGFLIYELHYFLFWTFPWSRKDPPEEKLVKKMQEHIAMHLQDVALEVVLETWSQTITQRRGRNKLWAWLISRWRKRQPIDVIRLRNQWSKVAALWTYQMKSKDNAAALSRFSYLSNMFDSLGALMTASWLAFITIFIYNTWLFFGDLEPIGTTYLNISYVSDILSYFGLGYTHISISVFSLRLFILVTGIEFIIFKSFTKMLWINRIHVRSSLIILAYTFLCDPINNVSNMASPNTSEEAIKPEEAKATADNGDNKPIVEELIQPNLDGETAASEESG